MVGSPAEPVEATLDGTRRLRFPPPASEPNAATALTFAACLAIIRRHRLPLALCILLVPTLAFVAITQVTPTYTATGTLIYDPSEFAARELQSILRFDPTTDAVMASQAEIVKGLSIAERVADQLHLDRYPEFNFTLRRPSLWSCVFDALTHWFHGRPAPPPTPAGIYRAVVLATQAAVRVQTVKATRVLEVSFTAEDPALATAAANRVMALYIADQLAAKNDAVRRANQWLEQRVVELRRSVEAAEDRIAAYRAREGLVQGVSAGLDTEQISRLNTDLLQARNELAQAQARLDAARGHAGAAAQAAIAPSVVQLRAQQDQVAAQLQSVLSRVGGSHPDAKALRDQLAELQRAVAAETVRVVAASEADVRAARAKVATLETNLHNAETEVDRDASSQVPLNAMQRDADAARTLLQAVLERIQQTNQQSAIETPDARVISEALQPGKPSSPKTMLLMAAASAAGILFGLLLVYLLELADSTIRSGEDVRSLLGLPSFALLPELSRRVLGRMRVEDYVAHKPLSPFAEQLRALRAGLWPGRSRPKIIAITAARPAEGKTTVAVALGRSAAMAGERVVVVDCDIRQPAFGRLFQADSGLGLIDHLLGHAELEAVIGHDPLTGMHYIPAGSAETNTIGLFRSEAMAKALRWLHEHYDLVLLDAPPAFAMADARIIASTADATLMCIRWRSTPRSVVQNSLELLREADARVVGAVLTRVDVRAHVRSGFADAEIYHPRYGGYFRE
jgi:succinoglycan biosynthesis transport protein ExoP